MEGGGGAKRKNVSDPAQRCALFFSGCAGGGDDRRFLDRPHAPHGDRRCKLPYARRGAGGGGGSNGWAQGGAGGGGRARGARSQKGCPKKKTRAPLPTRFQPRVDQQDGRSVERGGGEGGRLGVGVGDQGTERGVRVCVFCTPPPPPSPYGRRVVPRLCPHFPVASMILNGVQEGNGAGVGCGAGVGRGPGGPVTQFNARPTWHADRSRPSLPPAPAPRSPSPCHSFNVSTPAAGRAGLIKGGGGGETAFLSFF
jgi:hypothetical protein